MAAASTPLFTRAFIGTFKTLYWRTSTVSKWSADRGQQSGGQIRQTESLISSLKRLRILRGFWLVFSAETKTTPSPKPNMGEPRGTGLATGCTGKDSFEDQNFTPITTTLMVGIKSAEGFVSTGIQTQIPTTWWKAIFTEVSLQRKRR